MPSFLKVVSLIALNFAFSGISYAHNPIVTHTYAADPSARVFNGRIYIYPSHDRNDAQRYDMNDYHCYSSDDMVNWTDHGVILNLEQVPWAKPKSYLWAPDCIYKDGTYYLYFPSPAKEGKSRIGVATSTSPSGPFTPRETFIGGPQGIDPGVFLDDDRQAYLYWAGAGCQAAKLKPNMTELDGEPVKIGGLSNFFEGPALFKRNGNYYLTYPAVRPGGSGRGGNGQNYDYAMGKSPLGPFQYKGSFSTSELGGNIHGSVIELGGKWYCFYHDYSTSVGQLKAGFKRALRVDEMTFNADGTIQPLVWTTSGPPKLKNLDPFARVEAETLYQTDFPQGPHAISVEKCSEGGANVGSLENGDWLSYANVDFGAGARELMARVAAPVAGAKIEWRLDSLSGPIIGISEVPATGGWQTWVDVRCPVTLAKGVRDLYVKVVGGEGGELVNLNYFQFQPKTPADPLQSP